MFQFAGDLQLLQTRSPDTRSGEFGCYPVKLVALGNHRARYNCSPEKRQVRIQHLQRLKHIHMICYRGNGEKDLEMLSKPLRDMGSHEIR